MSDETKMLVAQSAKPCECGCGELTRLGRRFINHHNARGRVGRTELQRAASALNIEKANASRKDPERIAACLERARKNREMKQRKFLEVFARRAIKTPAYKAAQINSRMLRRWLDTDPAFARDYERAFEEAADRTEQKIASVAFKGVPKTIFNPKTGEKHTDYIPDTKVLMRIAAKQRPNEWGVQAQQPTLPAGDGVVTMVWGWAQMALPQAKPDLGKQNQLEEPTINAEIIKTEE